jgi:putative ATPase
MGSECNRSIFRYRRSGTRSRGTHRCPLHLRNAPTKLMRDLNYGKDYQYAHDIEGKVAGMDCLPESLRDRRYYHPTSESREKLLKQRMEEIERIREENRHKSW